MQKGIAPKLVERLKKAYASVRIGDPLEPGTLMGPLVDESAVADMMKALDQAKRRRRRGRSAAASGSTGRVSSSSRRSCGRAPT